MIFKKLFIKKKILTASAVLLSLTLAGMPIAASAKVVDDAIYTEDGSEDYEAEMARNKKQTIQTNLDPEWPQGPAISAAGAVVIDADSGAVLYGKNMNKHLFPASITKLMTALLAYENLDLDDTVTFSENAVFSIDRESSNIGMDAGESITVDEALSGLMVASANEVAIALGERVSGTESAFVSLMNERAAELGCKNTHFVTTNGLHDSDHYTSAYDMALIGREIFKYPELVKYTSLMNYHFEASANQPDDFWILNTNNFLTEEIPCDDVVGGKTGYTDQARETLVTFAERDGKKLVCVIMREEPPYQYYDTIDLLNYAFDNFKQISVAQNENRFTQSPAAFLSSGPDIFGNSTPFFYIGDETLMIPNSVSFSDLTAEITPVSFTPAEQSGEEKDSITETEEEKSKESKESDASQQSAAGNTSSTQVAAEQAAETEKASSSDTDLTASSLQEDGSRIVAVVQYKFNEYDLGSANILFKPLSTILAQQQNTFASRDSGEEGSDSGSTTAAAQYTPSGESKAPESVHGIRSLLFALVHTGAHGSVYLNILLLVPLVLAVTFLLSILFFVYDYFTQNSRRRRKQQRRAQRAHRQNAARSDEYDYYDSERTPRLSGEDNSVRRNIPDSEPVRSRRSRTNTAGRESNIERRVNTGRMSDTGRRTNSGRTSNTERRTNPGRAVNTERRTNPGRAANTERRTNTGRAANTERRTNAGRATNRGRGTSTGDSYGSNSSRNRSSGDDLYSSDDRY